MNTIKARIFCPTHGKLDFDDVVIKNGEPICRKCSMVLVFGDVKPRKLSKEKKKSRKRKGRK